jgi:hypothetical protein
MVWGSLINSLNMQVHDIFKCWKREKREARERKREKRDALLKIGFNLIWVIGFFNQIWVGLIFWVGWVYFIFEQVFHVNHNCK